MLHPTDGEWWGSLDPTCDNSGRKEGLGTLSMLPDQLVVRIFYTFPPEVLCAISLTSKAFFVFSSEVGCLSLLSPVHDHSIDRSIRKTFGKDFACALSMAISPSKTLGSAPTFCLEIRHHKDRYQTLEFRYYFIPPITVVLILDEWVVYANFFSFRRVSIQNICTRDGLERMSQQYHGGQSPNLNRPKSVLTGAAD